MQRKIIAGALSNETPLQIISPETFFLMCSARDLPEYLLSLNFGFHKKTD